ncbi:cubilin-like protein [Dinothrombium tinctorium]|uniref:Cubilin-like protein n=1 Tax=Dinothrombium tinctorium TaxID=1965070 RepID=A0A3S3PKS6_9ACAR|nr:cubilin-like protein [Dinothrombium tinctorium]RWS11711.1 cubilin-like protein [Dinothrombium tinctorium]RWS11747.1 cubilin-like protein [Dinothrombium tinctorium]
MLSIQACVTMIAVQLLVESVSFGAEINYKTYSKCNTTLEVLERKFLVTSPFYPNFYNKSVDCFMHISVSLEYRILVTFVDLNLEKGEDSKDCDSDYVSLYPINSSFKILRLCGQTSSNSSIELEEEADFFFNYNKNFILSYNNSLTIHLHYESESLSVRGFKFLIETIVSCKNKTLFAQFHTVNEYCSFDNFPLTYFKENDLCSVLIASDENNAANDDEHELHLQFTKLNLSSSPLTSGDEFCADKNYIQLISEAKNMTLCGSLRDESDNNTNITSLKLSASLVTLNVFVNSKTLNQVSYNALRKENSMGFCFQYKLMPKNRNEIVEKCDSRDGWHRWRSHCFKLVTDVAFTWEEARNYCRNHYENGRLASIMSEETQKFIEELISSLKP